MSTAFECINAIKEATDGKITDKQMEDILLTLQKKSATKRKRTPTLSEQEALIQSADELITENNIALAIKKRNHAINVLRKTTRDDFYKKITTGSKFDIADAIHALNVGMEGNRYGLGRSVDAVSHALESELVGGMVHDLRSAGLLKVAKTSDPDFELSVAKEMARLNGDVKVTPTGDKNAEKLAAIFVKYTESARALQNKAGAFIRKLPGYITRQGHDQLKIIKAGKERWVSRMKELLDPTTFDEIDDIDKFLDKTYTNLATGDHSGFDASEWMLGFQGPGNLAKRLSAERVLHFKNPESWIAYNNEFGRNSLFESVVNGLGIAARNTSVMRTWGVNPGASFEADIAQAISKAKDANQLDTVKKLTNWSVKAEFNAVTGNTLMKGDPSRAAFHAGVRSLISMSKLGGVVVSSLLDLPVRASVLRHNGMNFLDAQRKSLTSLFEGKSNSEKREIADLLNVGTQGLLGGVFERFHATDSIPGSLTKTTNLFFKMSLLTQWTDASSKGTGLILSRNLANQISDAKPFNALNDRLQATLLRYGIGQKEWELLSKADLNVADSEKFLMADAVRALPDNLFETTTERENLATSLSTYYSDQVRESMTFAGAKEKTLITQGISAGTPAGEAIRYIMQFKTFPLTFITKHLNREFNRGGQLDKTGLFSLMLTTTALGYVVMSTKDILKGRNPRTADDALEASKLFTAAMVQGGGLGLYGDFLFGEANRMGGGLIGSLAGPAAGMLEQYSAVLYAARTGKDPRAKAFKAVVDSTPFMNLFYTRMAMDHLFLYSIQESLNPGYLRRYERNIKNNNNQTFWLPPTSAK